MHYTAILLYYYISHLDERLSEMFLGLKMLHKQLLRKILHILFLYRLHNDFLTLIHWFYFQLQLTRKVEVTVKFSMAAIL